MKIQIYKNDNGTMSGLNQISSDFLYISKVIFRQKPNCMNRRYQERRQRSADGDLTTLESLERNNDAIRFYKKIF